MENEEDDFRKVNFTTRIDPYKGVLKLNLLEILDELDEETKKMILSDGGWWNLVSRQMAEDIVNSFSREHYNPEYTKLRELILTSESMPALIKQWAISEIESREHAKEAERYWSNAYYSLYHWTNDLLDRYFGRDRYEDRPKAPSLPDMAYGKDYSKELMKEVELKVQEWKKEFPSVELYKGNEEADKVIDTIINDLDKI